MASANRPSRVTLAQVAAAAGVAESTASRIINGYTKQFRVRDEVRARVLETAERMRYKPNPIVRSIAAKRTNLIAAVGEPLDEVDRAALHAAVRALRDAGKHVGSTFIDPDGGGYDLPSWRVDGAIVLRARRPEQCAAGENERAPYVALNGVAGPAGDAVGFDETFGVDRGVAHLAELGHTRIAFVHVAPNRDAAPDAPAVAAEDPGAPTAGDRARAFATAARRHGLVASWPDSAEPDSAEPDSAEPGAITETPEDAIERLLDTGVTAAAASSDLAACLLVQAARARGLETPDDLSVTGFYDRVLGRVASPRLTTVAMPAAEAGRRAAEMLLNRLAADGPIAPRELLLAPRLVVGRSVAPPAGARRPRPTVTTTNRRVVAPA